MFAVDHAAQGPVTAYVLVPDGDGYHLALAEADGARDGADLTLAIRSLPAGVPLRPVPDLSRRLTRDDLEAWAALGLALGSVRDDSVASDNAEDARTLGRRGDRQRPRAVSPARDPQPPAIGAPEKALIHLAGEDPPARVVPGSGRCYPPAP